MNIVQCLKIGILSVTFLITVLASGCKTSLVKSLDVNLSAVDVEEMQIQINRVDSLLQGSDSSSFSHGIDSDCFSTQSTQYEIEKSECTHYLSQLKQAYIHSDFYFISSDTIIMNVALSKMEAENPMYKYAYVKFGNELSFQEEGKAYGALPTSAKRVLHQLITFQLEKEKQVNDGNRR
ncbi:hypothetical protein [Lewinella sp. IMCC34183]|uniref:hypothetical protein n=1 Tax=Lewinella sp. IMCC34183 TaxID=2248762 RepID=UPI0013009E54|nr:hypothetical protein [Lewinella sp. IMCC34183]